MLQVNEKEITSAYCLLTVFTVLDLNAYIN